MDNQVGQIVETLLLLTNKIDALTRYVEDIEKRLNGLGKVDSIEHRVTSNQIDISDIKNAIERMEEFQNDKIESTLKNVVEKLHEKNSLERSKVNHRMDAQLLMLGKMSEEIYNLKEERS